MIRMIGNFRIGLGWSGERALDIDLEDFDQGGATKRKDGLPPVHPGEIIKQDILPHGPPQNFGPPELTFDLSAVPLRSTVIGGGNGSRPSVRFFPGPSNIQALQCLRILSEHAAFDLSCDGCPVA
jgi:hypothetical protein